MIKYFSKLTAEELEKFGEFVSSPYFNKSKRVTSLFTYLKSLYPEIKKEDINKEALYKHIYGNEPYNDSKARKLLSDFNEAFEKFLLQIEREKDELDDSVKLLRLLNNRGIRKRYEAVHKNIIAQLDKSFLKDDEYYYTRANIAYEDYYFNFEKQRHEYPPQLQERSDNFDYFFIFSKLHAFRDMMNHQSNMVKDLKFRRGFYDEIISHIEKNITNIKDNHPNIYIVYLSFMMETNLDNEAYVKEYETYLGRNLNKIPKNRLNYYYTYLTSYYMKKIRSGAIEVRRNLFNIYKEMDANEFYKIDNTINEGEFTNPTSIAIAISEYKWAENFIEKYKKDLGPGTSPDIVDLAYANIYFYRKNYSEALNQLQSVSDKSPWNYINSKFLLSKIYYEKRDFVQIEYILDNLIHYANRNKMINKAEIDAVEKFSAVMKKIVKCVNKPNEVFVLKKQTDKDKTFIPSRLWLYEKMDEIINK